MASVHTLTPPDVAFSDDLRGVEDGRRVLIRAAMRLRGNEATHEITVKKLSSTGLEAAAAVSLFVGARVEIQLPNIGWIPGSVVRCSEGGVVVRFGLIIDPAATLVQVTGRYVSQPSASATHLRPL